MRVVVVDDDPDVLQVGRHKLRRTGMELVGEPGDGRRGRGGPGGPSPDVVLLDLTMGAFAYYDKTDASRLSELLAEDLARFRHVLDGETSVPGWTRRASSAPRRLP